MVLTDVSIIRIAKQYITRRYIEHRFCVSKSFPIEPVSHYMTCILHWKSLPYSYAGVTSSVLDLSSVTNTV